MKTFLRKLSVLLVVIVLLCSLCSCGVISSLLPNVGFNSGGGGKKTEEEKFFTATYDLGYDDQKVIVSFSPSLGYTPQDPTRPGYTFRNWTLDGKAVDGTIPEGYKNDITMLAVWDIVTYRFVYENLTEEEFDAMPKTFTVEDEVDIPDPERLGYRFLGWNAELQTGLTVPAGQTGDYILRANWAPLTLNFSASANVGSIPVSASFSDQTLQIGSVVRAAAPVYQDGYRFVRWEMNGTAVCTTAVYSFPLSKVNTELKAVYEPQPILEWTKVENADLLIPDLLTETPGLILGGGIKSGDYTFTETGITMKAEYLAKLEPGEYSFYIAALSGDGEIGENRTFVLRLVCDPLATPGYEGVPEAGRSYLTKTVSWAGEQIPLVASTDEEFRKLVEYSVLVGGVLKLQAENATTGEYELDIYIWGDLNRRLQSGEKILSTATASVSFPMSPKVSISYLQDPNGAETTIKVSYTKGLNAFTSSQPASAMADRQNLLASSGRPEDFESFPIDALTETATIQTIYELEALPFGKKPVFSETAADAEAVYQTARGILRGIIDNGMNDYEKVKAIYCWLALNLTYDHVTADHPDGMTSAAYTLKGAFVDHLAVCDGYASAFRLLCQIEGIHAEEVIGLKRITDPSTGHAWNKVWIGGAVFGVDCTWARQKMGENEIVTTSYLLLDEKDLILCEHYENASSGVFWVEDLANASVFLPATVALDARNHSYVVRSQSDFDALVAYLKRNGTGAAEFYIAEGAPTLYSTSEYTVYTSGSYGYLFFET